MRQAFALAALLLSAIPCHAQEKPLPDALKRKHADLVWLVESATLGSLYAADFTLTARGLGERWPGKSGFVYGESDPLFGRHPSDTRIALTAAAQFGLQSFLRRKTERSKRTSLRWAGRVAFAFLVAGEIKEIRTWK